MLTAVKPQAFRNDDRPDLDVLPAQLQRQPYNEMDGMHVVVLVRALSLLTAFTDLHPLVKSFRR